MKDLPIRKSSSFYEEGPVNSFNPQIKDGYLEIAPGAFNIIHQLNIRSVSSLTSYIKSFPQPLAMALGWTIEDLNNSFSDLENICRGM